MQPLVDSLLAELARIGASTPGLVSAWLFGSAARGESDPRDVDVALLWDAALAPDARWKGAEAMALRLETSPVLGGRSVDWLDLSVAPPSLQQRVLIEGRRAFEADAVARIRFEAPTLSMANDFLEWQRPFLDLWLRQVARGR